MIEASVRLGLMPSDKKTIRAMLCDHGFYLQSGAYAKRSVKCIIDECNRIFQDGETVILNLSDGKYGCYLPLVPDEKNGEIRYILSFPRNMLEFTAVEVWISWKDGQDHSIMPRRKSTRQAAMLSKRRTAENEALHVFNENPLDNRIGDCAVRAVAGVLGISWGDAVRKLVQAQDYQATEINTETNIDVLLRREGFQLFGAIIREGKVLTGKQFCEIIHDMFQAGTKIFAYVGTNHVVAILVFDGNYQIVDTWDSTNRKIVKYWVKYPERPQRRIEPEKKSEKQTDLSVGSKIRHRAYGIGEITEISEKMATVRFRGDMEKKISLDWIRANCKSVE